MAYPINNMNYANYVHLDVELNDTLQLLEEKFKFDQNVFRHLTVRLNNSGEEKKKVIDYKDPDTLKHLFLRTAK